MQNKLFFGELDPNFRISEAYVAALRVREKSMKRRALKLKIASNSSATSL